MDSSERTGVSLAALRELAGRGCAGVGEGATTAAIVYNIIRPSTLSQLCPYVNLLRDEDRGVPTMVVIAPWTLSFRTLVDVLSQGQNPNNAEPAYVWLDVLACNLHSTDGNRLDAVSHPATATSSIPSRAKIDTVTLGGLPTSAFETYRRAIRAVASSGALAVVLDADATLFTSPWCLYGIWSYMSHKRASVAAGQLTTIIPLCVGHLDVLQTQLAWENLSLLQTSQQTPDSIHTLILEDVTSEENIPFPSGVSAAPAMGAECVAAPQGGGVHGGKIGTDGGGADGDEQDVETRVAAADAAIKFGLLTALGQWIQCLSKITDAARSITANPVKSDPPPPAGGGGAPTDTAAPPPQTEQTNAVNLAAAVPPLQAETADAAGDTAAAPPAPPPLSQPESTAIATDTATAEAGLGTSVSSPQQASDVTPHVDQLHSLAAASDALGCLLWAAGRPAEGEAHLRRARELYAGLPPQQPLLQLLSLLHLGALLHVLPQSLTGDEAELLLRGAITQLDAAHEEAGVAGTSSSAAPGALMSAHARHFLARLLCLQAGSNSAASSAYPRDARGLHHLQSSGAKPITSTTTTTKAVSRSDRTESARSGTPRPAASANGAMATEVAPVSGAASMQLPPGCAPAETAALLRAALPAFKAHYGEEHPLTATLLSNLALALKDQGKLDEAEELLRRALVARETFHGPSHVDTMRCMNNLAGLLEAQGKLEEAEALLRKTAELAASSLGPSHAYTATALSNLGVALRKAGKLDEAEELFKTALEIREKLLGPLALDTAASLSDMTMLMLDQERLTEAEPLFRRILDIRQLVLGPDHRDTAVSLCDLANLLVQMDRPVDAEPLLRRAVTVQVRCLGPGHEDTASATRELAKVLAQQGHVEEAEKLFRRALAVMESVLGPNHPETVITVNHLAVLLKDAGQSAEVEAMFKRVLSLTDTLDLDTTATASPTVRATRRRLRAAAMIAMRGLAELAGAAGRLEEAEVFSCRALVASERALGPVHPVTLTCAEGLAEVLRQLDLLEDAGELYARLVEALAEEYGADSEHVIKYLAFYEEVYAQMRTQKLERERQQQELQREEQQDEDEDEKDGEADDSKDEGDGEDTTEVESAAASSQDAKHVRIAPGARGTDGDGPVSRSAESVGSIMSALFGPLGRSMKKRAMATHRQQSRSAAAATGGDNSDGRQDGNRHAVGGLRHSFASFVSRRGQQQHKHQGSGQQRSTSRAESVVGRVHSSLVAAGRIGSGGPLGDARKSRRAAAYSGHDGNGEPVARADCDQSCVSPGLPLRDLAEDAAAGAAVVSLAAPRTSDTVSSADVSSGGPLKAAAPRGSSGSQVGSEEVYDPMTTPLITASAFGYSSVTAAGGGAGSRSLSRRQPASVVVVAHRRSSVDALDARRSVTNSMISLRRGLSKKALLQQADVDLDDDEDKDEDNDDRFAGDRKSPQDVGQASRRFGITFEVARPGPPPTAISADENDEDTSSVGCCGFGGRKARPVAPR